ncbi:hypothetical protein VN97_g12584, partial [Penicillium thymicola]
MERAHSLLKTEHYLFKDNFALPYLTAMFHTIIKSQR